MERLRETGARHEVVGLEAWASWRRALLVALGNLVGILEGSVSRPRFLSAEGSTKTILSVESGGCVELDPSDPQGVGKVTIAPIVWFQISHGPCFEMRIGQSESLLWVGGALSLIFKHQPRATSRALDVSCHWRSLGSPVIMKC